MERSRLWALGEAYGDLALYDFAADWYEHFAKTYPQDEGAASALSDAAMLRLGLGDGEQATRDARAFAKAYGNVAPTQTADLAFALGSSYADHEEWDKARAMLVGSMATIDAAALDVRIRAHALLGRVYARSGDGGRSSALAESATAAARPRSPSQRRCESSSPIPRPCRRSATAGSATPRRSRFAASPAR